MLTSESMKCKKLLGEKTQSRRKRHISETRLKIKCRATLWLKMTCRERGESLSSAPESAGSMLERGKDRWTGKRREIEKAPK